MDMTTWFSILDEFQTLNGWRYRYVAGKWWIWDVDRVSWRTYDSRAVMARSFLAVVNSMYDEGHSIRVRASKDYMINRFMAYMVPRLRADELEGNPKPGTWRPEP